MSTGSYIHVENVSKTFGEFTALEDISFDIQKGALVALIGPNGSGKSTLARLLVGLEKPTVGSVSIDGNPPEVLSQQLGYVPQRFSFDRTTPMTVREFLRLSTCGKSHHEHKEAIEQALHEVEMAHIVEKQLGVLSGGQLQRVLIARALLHERNILILDEPLAGIDVAGETVFYEFLQKMNKEKGITCIIVSHELDFVFRFASQVLCVNKRLMCRGIPHEVLTREVLEEMYGSHLGHYHHHCDDV